VTKLSLHLVQQRQGALIWQQQHGLPYSAAARRVAGQQLMAFLFGHRQGGVAHREEPGKLCVRRKERKVKPWGLVDLFDWQLG
jgi:hypothetical protein